MTTVKNGALACALLLAAACGALAQSSNGTKPWDNYQGAADPPINATEREYYKSDIEDSPEADRALANITSSINMPNDTDDGCSKLVTRSAGVAGYYSSEDAGQQVRVYNDDDPYATCASNYCPSDEGEDPEVDGSTAARFNVTTDPISGLKDRTCKSTKSKEQRAAAGQARRSKQGKFATGDGTDITALKTNSQTRVFTLPGTKPVLNAFRKDPPNPFVLMRRLNQKFKEAASSAADMTVDLEDDDDGNLSAAQDKIDAVAVKVAAFEAKHGSTVGTTTPSGEARGNKLGEFPGSRATNKRHTVRSKPGQRKAKPAPVDYAYVSHTITQSGDNSLVQITVLQTNCSVIEAAIDDARNMTELATQMADVFGATRWCNVAKSCVPPKSRKMRLLVEAGPDGCGEEDCDNATYNKCKGKGKSGAGDDTACMCDSVAEFFDTNTDPAGYGNNTANGTTNSTTNSTR